MPLNFVVSLFPSLINTHACNEVLAIKIKSKEVLSLILKAKEKKKQKIRTFFLRVWHWCSTYKLASERRAFSNLRVACSLKASNAAVWALTTVSTYIGGGLVLYHTWDIANTITSSAHFCLWIIKPKKSLWIQDSGE